MLYLVDYFRQCLPWGKFLLLCPGYLFHHETTHHPFFFFSFSSSSGFLLLNPSSFLLGCQFSVVRFSVFRMVNTTPSWICPLCILIPFWDSMLSFLPFPRPAPMTSSRTATTVGQDYKGALCIDFIGKYKITFWVWILAVASTCLTLRSLNSIFSKLGVTLTLGSNWVHFWDFARLGCMPLFLSLNPIRSATSHQASLLKLCLGFHFSPNVSQGHQAVFLLSFLGWAGQFFYYLLHGRALSLEASTSLLFSCTQCSLSITFPRFFIFQDSLVGLVLLLPGLPTGALSAEAPLRSAWLSLSNIGSIHWDSLGPPQGTHVTFLLKLYVLHILPCRRFITLSS